MPDLKSYNNKQEFISACISQNIKEGLNQEQVSGKCYGMWENAQKTKCEENIIKAQAEVFKI